MSRSVKGAKGPGYEYWSRRPTNFLSLKPCKETKKITHAIERAQAKEVIQKELKDL